MKKPYLNFPKTIKNRCCFLMLFLGLLFFTSLNAQVSIGDGGSGQAVPPQDFSVLELISNNSGLRLSHLSTTERDALEATASFQAEKLGKGVGLTIFNTTTGCVDYWNGQKWISLCQGNSSFIGGQCADTPVPSSGGDVNCTITDPTCEILGDYTFSVIQGEDYSTLTVLDAGAGQFKLNFDANNWATDRQAVVLVTSPCGTTSIYVFVEKGDATGCGTTTVPPIKSANGSTSLCIGGAVYLYLDGYPDPTTNTFIWTLNGVQVGSGNSLAVTQPGKYIVYGDKPGCSNKQEITVSYSSSNAPSPVSLIVIGNNGMACGAGGTVTLVSSPPATGEVVWYKDGQKTTQTGTTISADKGYWQAAVEDGSCSSTLSEGVTVYENQDGGSIPTPVMKINGVTSGWTLCRNGSAFLEVDGMMVPGVTYTWYADNTEIGTGSGIYYKVPSSSQVVIRLRATGTGCASEALSVQTVSTSVAPNAPFLSCNTPGNVLCGGEAILTASAENATSYLWYKDGAQIMGQTASSITILQSGNYTACAVSADGCVSIQSGAVSISASDYAAISWVNCPTTNLLVNTKKTYSVNLDFPQNATYSWSVDGGASITNGQGTSSIIVLFPATAATVNVTCIATNACGDVSGSPITVALDVSTGCTDAQIKSTSDLAVSIKKNASTTLSINATGSPSLTYQWYKGAVPIAGATASSYEYQATEGEGNFTFYCLASVGGGCATATSSTFTVTVNPDPATLTQGNGSFSGKTCFDIAYSNDNASNCAPLAERSTRRTDFSLRTPQDPSSGALSAPYTGVQVYTFKPSSPVSNVRFDYVDASGKVIESITPQADYSGGNISTPCKVTVSYKASLNTDLRGLTRSNAFKVSIYAIYNNGTADIAVKLTAAFQDCTCCGAKTTSGGWLNFMCHNLGADETLDPFTTITGNADGSGGTKGYLYQWGRPADGYEKRNSAITSTLATNNTATAPAAVVGKFVGTTTGDWRSGGGEASRWGNGTYTDLNMPKAVNDPCPPGWKVPSQKQWASIYTNTTTPNIWTLTGGNGFKVGTSLFLPFANCRRPDTGAYDSTNCGIYWTSSKNGTSTYNVYLNGTVYIANAYVASYGFSVRCVEE